MNAGACTILVNSCDAYSDCWEPFFRLFTTYWPDCQAPIVLNTDYLDYSYPGINVRSSRAGAMMDRPDLSWSERTAFALENIRTPVVLYLQEDYFFNGPVREEWVQLFTQRIQESDIVCIRLMEVDISGPWKKSDDPTLWEIPKHSKYRHNLQAALWKTEVLRSYLRKHETAWEFEELGSVRARRHSDRIMCVNRDMFMDPADQIVPYVPTGIVKGKWVRERVVPLFADHGIEVDFSVRGFWQETFVSNPIRRATQKAHRGIRLLRSLV